MIDASYSMRLHILHQLGGFRLANITKYIGDMNKIEQF